MGLRDDVILRMVSQLVEALLRAAGLRKKKDLPAAEQAIGDGLVSLGLPLDVITRLDATTLAGMLGDKRPLVGAALRELALVREVAGELDEADRLHDTAERLLAGADIPEELLPWVDERD